MNAWHRLINAGSEPAILLGVTNAPEMIDLYRNFDFIFNCDFTFHERFIGDDYFAVQPERFTEGWRNAVASNMLVDVWATDLHNTEKKSAGGSVSVFQLGGSTLSGHIAQWPVGMYHKAHAHNPGAILVGLTGTGYFNMWPGELGIHPYEDGNGEMVFEADWGPMSIYSPPDGWYHQHFNTGSTIARHLAFHWGSMWYPRARDIRRHRKDEIMTSVSEGGTMIEYNEEDPEIRRRFEARLKAVGVECLMPPVQT